MIVKARRLRRPLKIAIQVGILLTILAAISTVGFVEYSAQPGFCDNCHNMVPYYESWTTSSHNDVPCIKCHYAPGIKAEAMGKLQAANQVVKYVTGTYGLRPWAEIEDAACLRSGCHSERTLEGQVSYKGVLFDHSHHLGELRRGKQLRCTSCHSQIVQGEHLAVTESTCILCHFKGQPPDNPIAGCTGCHPTVPEIVSPAGFTVDHPQYIEELGSCISCHDRVTEGSGVADQGRCFVCHNEPERIEEFENTTLMHRVHIAESNVECAQCHLPMEHRLVSIAGTFELECQSCHQGTHEAQRRLYAGVGGHGAESRPSSMFLARVSCKGCHELAANVQAHEQVDLAGEASCLSCHGTRYSNVLPSWLEEMERKLGGVGPVVTAARQALGRAPARTRPAADSLLQLAEENVEFVRTARGAHNVNYADELLRAALGLVRDAVQVGSLPYAVPEIDLGLPVTGNTCLQCHLGAERMAVPFDGTTFDHEPHVARAGFTCATCHSGLDQHGETMLTNRSTCDACHHTGAGPSTCESCHQGADGAPTGVVELARGDFRHEVHTDVGLSCSTCHDPPRMDAAGLRCETCHEPHHQPEASCLSCHRGGVKEKHAMFPQLEHPACTMCHGEKAEGLVDWSREVCTVCHTDRTEHNAPLECTACHPVSPMREGG